MPTGVKKKPAPEFQSEDSEREPNTIRRNSSGEEFEL
jgi:hypothetical protein